MDKVGGGNKWVNQNKLKYVIRQLGHQAHIPMVFILTIILYVDVVRENKNIPRES